MGRTFSLYIQAVASQSLAIHQSHLETSISIITIHHSSSGSSGHKSIGGKMPRGSLLVQRQWWSETNHRVSRYQS